MSAAIRIRHNLGRTAPPKDGFRVVPCICEALCQDICCQSPSVKLLIHFIGIQKLITRADFQTDDVERTRAFFQDGYGWHSRVQSNKGPYGFSVHSWSSTRVSVGSIECRAHEVIRAHVPPSIVLIHLPLDHQNRYSIGRSSLTAMSDRAVILPSDYEYSLRSTPGLRFGLAIDGDLLAEKLENRWPGGRGQTRITAHEMQLTAAERQQLFTLYRRFRDLAKLELSPDEDPAVWALESEIASWCAETILKHAGCQPFTSRDQVRMDQTIDWIDRNLAHQISVRRLAEVSFISPRLLTKICKAHCGMAPIELVQSRRLAATQRQLCNAAEDTAVSKVALDCGFTHLGRFARAYRRAFGELPSETLKKARCKP